MLRAMLAAALSAAVLALAVPQASAQESRQISQKTVGLWALSGFINPQGAPYCVAARQVGATVVLFARFQQGYGLAVQSPNFWLRKGSTVKVRLVAGDMGDNTVDGQAMTTNVVLVPLTSEPTTMRRMASLPQIVFTAEGETVTIPLDGFSEALPELERCVEQRGQMGPQTSGPASPSAPPSPSPSEPAPAPVSGLPIPEVKDRPIPIINEALTALGNANL